MEEKETSKPALQLLECVIVGFILFLALTTIGVKLAI